LGASRFPRFGRGYSLDRKGLRRHGGISTLRRSQQPGIKAMPRTKTESLQEGMVVSSDVKNIDNMLLIPAGCVLTARQISILQAWGVTEIEVEKGGDSDAGNTDVLAKLSPEALVKLTEELKACYWKMEENDPVFMEIFNLMLRRNARRGGRVAAP
jgi:hypothetical protein